jgi:hypothetical protein
MCTYEQASLLNPTDPAGDMLFVGFWPSATAKGKCTALVRRQFWKRHTQMLQINTNRAAKYKKNGPCPTPPWALVPNVPHFYEGNTSGRTTSARKGPF